MGTSRLSREEQIRSERSRLDTRLANFAQRSPRHAGQTQEPYLEVTFFFFAATHNKKGFPGGSDGKQSTCNAGDRFSPWVEKIPWRREWLLTPVLPGEFQGQRSPVGYSPWGCKESDMTE